MNKITNLVIGGGGTVWYAYAAAIKELETRGYLKDVKNYVGTSAGSMLCTILACGGSATYIDKLANDFKIGELIDSEAYFLRDMFGLIIEYGYNNGKTIYTSMKAILGELTGDPSITFKGLYNYNGSNLVITGTNVTKRRIDYFNMTTSPDMEIALAVRISSSVPLFYRPVKYNNDLYVDGGLMENYPIKYFKEGNTSQSGLLAPREGNTSQSGLLAPREGNTLGLKTFSSDTLKFIDDTSLDNDHIISNDNNVNIKRSSKTLKDFMVTIMNISLDLNLKLHVDNDDWAHTIKIDVGNMDSLDFNMTERKISFLKSCGTNAVIKFLN